MKPGYIIPGFKFDKMAYELLLCVKRVSYEKDTYLCFESL